ncbi:hypothetical protein [Methylacidimicrobium sp. B4]|uniref:hypothetical protein n=1 Tax=Methylacidimicrobium sp. B4 TaxID=2796139 RepID=UPI001A8C1C71|nr:hypothetical protein [Methylacidimicrobium sp. B4]QSR84788.1 hypothetical protein MacB4_00410 [Methylacidimicrobium sp. B4]
MDKQSGETGRRKMSLGDLAQRARELVAEAVKGSSRVGQEAEKPAARGKGRSVEQAKAQALRRARRSGEKTEEPEGKTTAASSAERLRQWRQEFLRHSCRFGWASELLQSEEWRKAGRALAEERLRDSAIHLAQAGLRVGSQGLGTVIGGMLGAEAGPAAAVAAWAGGTFLGTLGARAASALDVHLSPEGQKPLRGGRERGR